MFSSCQFHVCVSIGTLESGLLWNDQIYIDVGKLVVSPMPATFNFLPQTQSYSTLCINFYRKITRA